jgi:zinc/manganese transport system permease protein
MFEMFQLPFMLQSLVACLLLSVILSYFGVHVVTRGIVFIDLALAQISSVGAVFGLLIGQDPRVCAMAFTLVGAVGISCIQSNDKRVPQEAIIGIIYAVSAALSILMMTKVPHGDGDVTDILFGNILAVTPAQIQEMLLIFGAVGLLHLVFHRQFYAQTRLQAGHSLEAGNPDESVDRIKQNPQSTKPLLNRWNMLFYLTLALIISSAVNSSGVLQVFSYLIVPAVCALLLCKRFGLVLLTAVGIATTASIGGLYGSFTYDLPTGASIVACFGVLFGLSLGIHTLLHRHRVVHNKPQSQQSKAMSPSSHADASSTHPAEARI